MSCVTLFASPAVPDAHSSSSIPRPRAAARNAPLRALPVSGNLLAEDLPQPVAGAHETIRTPWPHHPSVGPDLLVTGEEPGGEDSLPVLGTSRFRVGTLNLLVLGLWPLRRPVLPSARS
jgi:hypothetical protein